MKTIDILQVLDKFIMNEHILFNGNTIDTGADSLLAVTVLWVKP